MRAVEITVEKVELSNIDKCLAHLSQEQITDLMMERKL